MDCNLCHLRSTARRVIAGEGPKQARIWFVDDAPTEVDDIKGRSFQGRAGSEHDTYLRMNGINRSDTYVTKLVKCRPPNSREPTPDEITSCAVHLNEELTAATSHTVIAALGKHTAKYLLGRDVKIEKEHGIPQRSDNCVVIPMLHPAVGLYSPSMMQLIMDDYAALADVVNGKLAPEDFDDKYPNPVYRWAKRDDHVYLQRYNRYALDTESVGDDLFSVQISVVPGESIIFTRDYPYEYLSSIFNNPDNLWIFHNAKHDMRELTQVGLKPAKYYDTMLAANLLQNVPRGLKALAYRLAGMRMSAYEDIIDPLTQKHALEYLLHCLPVCEPWPRPDKVDGKQPHKTVTKIKGIIRDYMKNQETKLYDRYLNLTPLEREALALAIGNELRLASVADLDDQTFRQYAGADSDATLRIYGPIMERISQAGLESALRRDLDVVPIIIQMEDTGVAADKNYFQCLELVIENQKRGCAEEIEDLVGFPVNPGSDDQVASLLFDKLGFKPTRRTRGGSPSTKDEVLELLKHRHPAVPLIQEYREKAILQNNFIAAVLNNLKLHGDGRVHPEISQITTATGRYATKVVNLIAWPKDKDLRNGFVARPGCVFLAADYSQIELRVLAHVSQEPTMLEAFNAGLDMHALTAAEVRGKRVEDVTDDERFAAKRVNFGVPYGISASGLFNMLEHLGWTLQGCEEFLSQYFRVRKKIGLWMERVKAEARRYGYVRCFMGRIRRIPEVKSSHMHIRNAGDRQAINAPIQMGAHEIMKVAMARLFPIIETINQEGGYCRAVLETHDDLKVEVEESLVPAFAPVMKWVMENAVKISVPTPVDFKVGKTWGSMEAFDGGD